MRVVPATNPNGGWGAEHPLVPAPALGTPATPGDEEYPAALRRLALPGGDADPETLSGGERDRAVRDGLLRFLATALGAGPGEVVLDDGPCPACGNAHDLSASGPDGTRRHFAVAVHGRHAVYAVSRYPVGLAAGLPDGGPWPLREARNQARRAARAQAVSRGQCSRERDRPVQERNFAGRPDPVEYWIRYVDAPTDGDAAVSVVCELPDTPL